MCHLVFLLYLNTQLLCPTGGRGGGGGGGGEGDWFMFIVSLGAVVSHFSLVPRFSLHLDETKKKGGVRGEPGNEAMSRSLYLPVSEE